MNALFYYDRFMIYITEYVSSRQ